jgi:hypothetical protein
MQHAEKREPHPDKKDGKKDDAKVFISFVCVCVRARAWLSTELLWMHLIWRACLCLYILVR